MMVDADEAGIDQALRQEPSVVPSPEFAARVMGSVREQADATQAIPFPWVRLGLGLGLAGLVLLLAPTVAPGPTLTSAMDPVVALVAQWVSLTTAGTLAVAVWSFRLADRS